MALNYFLSTQLGLHTQVMILIPSAVVSIVMYSIADGRTIKKNNISKPVVTKNGEVEANSVTLGDVHPI